MKKNTKTLAHIAIFAALNYAVFSYGKIDIPLTGGSSVAIHVANAVVVVSALLLGPVEGGIAGAVGLSIADLLDPRYVTSAPKTFRHSSPNQRKRQERIQTVVLKPDAQNRYNQS